jgi:hypothetical protein
VSPGCSSLTSDTEEFDRNTLPEEQEERLGFAQKLLLANEENTFNINDLWVSAAVAQDSAVFDDEEDDDNAIEATPQHSLAPTPSSELESPSLNGSVPRRGNRISSAAYRSFPAHRQSTSLAGRRFSASSQLPAIFSNTGLAEPPAIAAAYEDVSPAPTSNDPFFTSPQTVRVAGGLSAIAERPVIHEETRLVEKTSTWNSLPAMMIFQYGLLALHNTTHDQLFLSFLVT